MTRFFHRLPLVFFGIASLVFAMTAITPNVSAQDGKQEESPGDAVASDPTYDERLALAKRMHELRPVRDQVDGAIAQYAQTRPQNERDSFRIAMRNVFNIKALEKISEDAYVETFTVEELRAMVGYYSMPEAQSASEKFGDYAAIIYPEIVRMLDRAAIRLKTGQ